MPEIQTSLLRRMISLTDSMRLWLARGLIGLVLFINVQCALLFILQPQAYSASFELSGAVGAAAVRGMGVLFLMWNIPYLVAFINPRKYRVSLFEAIAMQTIGLVGETFIFLSLPTSYNIARATVIRFIIFDAGGVVALWLAAWMSRKITN